MTLLKSDQFTHDTQKVNAIGVWIYQPESDQVQWIYAPSFFPTGKEDLFLGLYSTEQKHNLHEKFGEVISQKIPIIFNTRIEKINCKTVLLPKTENNIIALTAHALREEKEIYLNSGMNDFLPKPYTENQLLSALSKWISKK